MFSRPRSSLYEKEYKKTLEDTIKSRLLQGAPPSDISTALEHQAEKFQTIRSQLLLKILIRYFKENFSSLPISHEKNIETLKQLTMTQYELMAFVPQFLYLIEAGKEFFTGEMAQYNFEVLAKHPQLLDSSFFQVHFDSVKKLAREANDDFGLACLLAMKTINYPFAKWFFNKIDFSDIYKHSENALSVAFALNYLLDSPWIFTKKNIETILAQQQYAHFFVQIFKEYTCKMEQSRFDLLFQYPNALPIVVHKMQPLEELQESTIHFDSMNYKYKALKQRYLHDGRFITIVTEAHQEYKNDKVACDTFSQEVSSKQSFAHVFFGTQSNSVVPNHPLGDNKLLDQIFEFVIPTKK